MDKHYFKINCSAQLGEYYELRKVRMLRLYIVADRKTDSDVVDVDESLKSDDLSEEQFNPTSQLTVEGRDIVNRTPVSGLLRSEISKDISPHTPLQLTDDRQTLPE